MSHYKNDTSWSTIGLIFCLALAFLLPTGISATRELTQKYDLPIYISEEVSISGYSSYTISGELTNRSNKAVKIDLLEIIVSGKEDNTIYYADKKLEKRNIVIPARDSYQIYFEDIIYVQNGNDVAKGELTEVNIDNCIINGKSVELKVKKGQYFVAPGINPGGQIVFLAIGSIGTLGMILIIIYKIKNRA